MTHYLYGKMGIPSEHGIRGAWWGGMSPTDVYREAALQRAALAKGQGTMDSKGSAPAYVCLGDIRIYTESSTDGGETSAILSREKDTLLGTIMIGGTRIGQKV